MTAIDFHAIKPGDYVTARLKVCDNTRVGFVRARNDFGHVFSLAESDIISHEPAPDVIEVGDWVTIRSNPAKYRVLAIADGAALVKYPDNTPDAVPVSHLTKTTPPE